MKYVVSPCILISVLLQAEWSLLVQQSTRHKVCRCEIVRPCVEIQHECKWWSGEGVEWDWPPWWVVWSKLERCTGKIFSAKPMLSFRLVQSHWEWGLLRNPFEHLNPIVAWRGAAGERSNQGHPISAKNHRRTCLEGTLMPILVDPPATH